MKYGNWTMGQTEALLNKLGGDEVAMGILRGTIEVITKLVSFITHTFMVMVDETQTVEELVKAEKFNWSNDIVSKNFPKPANGQKSEREIVLFHFNKGMFTKTIIAEMDKAGYKPATIWDLLGLAAKEPDLQRKFSITALGSICRIDGACLAAFLGGNSCERMMDLDDISIHWDDDCRFAAVRK
jgi:hypothetical protein